MKKLLTLTALLGAASLSFGQGYVNFGNTTGSRTTTNGVSAAANPGGAVGNWYYELLVAPTTQTTIDASLTGWTAVSSALVAGAPTGTNTASAGRVLGFGSLDTSSVQVPGFAPGTTANFAIVGWSANLGASWNAVYQGRPMNTVSGVGNSGSASWTDTTEASTTPTGYGGVALSSGGWYGISGIATSIGLQPAGGPYNSVFGLASTGQIPGFAMNFYVVPEPATLALAGLGTAALLIFRRRK